MSSEKRIFRNMMIAAVVLFLAFAAFLLVFLGLRDRTFDDRLEDYSELNNISNNLEDYSFQTDPADGIEFTRAYRDQTGRVHLVLKPIREGNAYHAGKVYIVVNGPEMDNQIISDYTVYASGLVKNDFTLNFTGYRVVLWALCIYTILNMLVLFIALRASIKQLGYAYFSIFSFGFWLWMSVVSLFLLWVCIRGEAVVSAYNEITNCPGRFILVTMPFILVFSIALTVSNISLIRHERFRFRNILGILCTFLLVFGAIGIYLLDGLVHSGSDLQMLVWHAFVNTFYILYALLECFLIGSIFCGLRAARHTPKMDKDFIIILGCKIRPDGTLYPLIQGRVDRAIGFYRKQLETTGKAAILLPSGGKGRDEVTSEAEAMAAYLRDQGIPEDHILIENQSANTKQNMLFSRKLMEEKMPGAKAAFSTTNYHVFRSGIIARQCGMEIDGMGSRTKWYFWPNAYIREVVGMLTYEWKILLVIYFFIIILLNVIQFSF